jgi:hypothetical protein
MRFLLSDFKNENKKSRPEKPGRDYIPRYHPYSLQKLHRALGEPLTEPPVQRYNGT